MSSNTPISSSVRAAVYAGNDGAFAEAGYLGSLNLSENSKIKLFGGLGSGFENASDLSLVGYGQYTQSYGNFGSEARLKAVVGNDNKAKLQLRISPLTFDVPVSDNVSIYGNVNATFMYNSQSKEKFSTQPRAFVGATYSNGDFSISAEVNGYNLDNFKGIHDTEFGLIASYKF